MVCWVLPSSPSATGNDAVIFAHAPHAADKTRSSSAHRPMRRRSHEGVGWCGGGGSSLENGLIFEIVLVKTYDAAVVVSRLPAAHERFFNELLDEGHSVFPSLTVGRIQV